MKKGMKTAIALLLLTTGLSAKDAAGVFMNAADFKNNKLAYAVDCNKEVFKVRLHDLLHNTASLTIKAGKEQVNFKKDEVYGYRDCKDRVFRLYQNEAYQIVEGGNIVIYKIQKNLPQEKGFKFETVYYFSAGADSDIILLNIKNLNSVYGSNERFMELLENFKGDLSEYDARHQMFRLNYLFIKSQQL